MAWGFALLAYNDGTKDKVDAWWEAIYLYE
jgi:hypothetical protein